ncbi:uncharacterized protein LOC144542134 [Centroberyx gerrardi]
MLQKGSAPCITLSISREVWCHTGTHTQRSTSNSRREIIVSTADLESPGMDRGLILLVAALMIYVAPGVHGTFHLSFANNTQVNISRSGCGVTKLCVETPDDCDPMGSTDCLFASLDTGSLMPPNGTDLAVQLRGDSAGYIALGLTVNPNEGTTMVFICAQNSSDNTFFFRTMQRNNSGDMALSPTERIVRDIRGSVNGTVIKCEFTIPNLNATSTRSSQDTTFTVLVGSGSVNAGNIGAFNVTLNAGSLNLADPASNIPTTTMSTTPMSTTTMSTTPMSTTTMSTTPMSTTTMSTTPMSTTTMSTTPMSTTTMSTTPMSTTPMSTTAMSTTAMSSNAITTGANTTAGSGAFQPHAVLVLLSVLTGSVMLRT